MTNAITRTTKIRALPLFVLGTALGAGLLSAPASAGPSIIGSIYTPDIDASSPSLSGSGSASPDGLTLEIRQPVGSNFWVGAGLATSLNSDNASGLDAKLGTALNFNLGAQAEFNHYVAGYAYLGYGTAQVLSNIDDIDGEGVIWGAGLQFRLADHFFADAGYVSLFDGDMEGNAGTSYNVTINGPRVGLGFRF